jgi:hypothetical protein
MPTKVFTPGEILTAANTNADRANKSISNAVINGAMDIWQRGVSPTWIANNTNNFGPDRWYGISPAGRTVTRQPAGLTGFRFASRWQRTSGNSDTSAINIGQILATDDSIPFAGKTVTLSFYARRGANYSGGNLLGNVTSGTGTDQNYIFPGFSGAASVLSETFPLTTDWQRFTKTGTVSSSATQLVVRIETGNLSGTAGTNDWFEITGVQLEEGTVFNDFRRNADSIQGELAACQRYYWRWSNATSFLTFQPCFASGTTTVPIQIRNPVTMRIAAISFDNSGIQIQRSTDDAQYSNGTWTLNGVTPDHSQLLYTHGSGVFTAREQLNLRSGAAGGSIGFNAEL